MTDRARLERALRAADAAGDVEAAKQFAAALRASEEPQKPVGDIGSAINDPLVSMASGALATPISGLAGIAGTILPGEPGQGARWVERVQQALTYQPRTRAGEATTAAVAYPFEKLAQGADWLGQKAADATGSPAVGTVVNTATQVAPALLTRGRVSNGNRGPHRVEPPSVPRQGEPAQANTAQAGRQAGLERVSEKPPTVEELAAQAKAAYKRASDAGITISEKSLTGLKTRIVSDLKREGLDKTLHPSTTAALKRITDSKGNISLDDVEILRRIAQDAQKSMAPADKRLAGRIVDQIDDFVEALDVKDVTSGNPKQAAALKEARGLYSRQKKAEEINALIERAKISAPNFSGSGLENALRTEFRALAKNEKKMRRFTPEERAAILKVAKGGKLENAMRFIGKFAPTGIVSTALTSGLGTLALGPGGMALPVVGAAGREVATRLTMRNATAAEEIMRAGPQASKAKAKAKEREPLTY